MRCHKYSRSFGSIDRVDRWAVWRVLASLLPQTTLPQASPAAQLELDTRARRLRARGVAENAILGAFRCRSPPSHPTPPPRQSPPNRPVPHHQVRRCSGKPTHARALRRRRRSALARLIARAVCGGYGGGGGRLHRPSRALRAPRVTRVYAYVVTAHRARHRRFRSPRAGPACARCCGGGACSLVRAEAEAVGLGVAFSYTARHARHARARARHHRASHASSPFLFPHAPTRVRCDGGGARSLDSARGVWRLRWRWRAVEGAGGYIARHARYARRASRACARTSSPRIARVITVFRPPRARPARRARCCGGGAR